MAHYVTSIVDPTIRLSKGPSFDELVKKNEKLKHLSSETSLELSDLLGIYQSLYGEKDWDAMRGRKLESILENLLKNGETLEVEAKGKKTVLRISFLLLTIILP